VVQLEAKERTDAQFQSVDEQLERQRREKEAEREEAQRVGKEIRAQVGRPHPPQPPYV
jgi:hypothetical protein